MTFAHKLMFTAFLVAGCTSAEDSARGPIGKADVLGTCSKSACGGPAHKGNCWCDDECTGFGDCCANKEDVCPSPAKICGGQLGAACSDGEYCNFSESAMCGATDQTGTCQPQPFVCSKVIITVCGCDGMTYNNECEAHAAGTSVVHAGACQTTHACGGIAGLTCGSDSFCDFGANSCSAPDASGTCSPRPFVCPHIVSPVCGCNGQTFNNSCEANRAGTAVVSQGACSG